MTEQTESGQVRHGDYRDARGASPWQPGQLRAEEAIRAGRDGISSEEALRRALLARDEQIVALEAEVKALRLDPDNHEWQARAVANQEALAKLWADIREADSRAEDAERLAASMVEAQRVSEQHWRAEVEAAERELADAARAAEGMRVARDNWHHEVEALRPYKALADAAVEHVSLSAGAFAASDRKTGDSRRAWLAQYKALTATAAEVLDATNQD